MDSYAGLIAEIGAQPDFYLREPTLARFEMLVYGYWLACLWRNVPDVGNDFAFFAFNDWLREKFPEMLPAHNWSAFLRAKYKDESLALQKFFEEYNEYNSLKLVKS